MRTPKDANRKDIRDNERRYVKVISVELELLVSSTLPLCFVLEVDTIVVIHS